MAPRLQTESALGGILIADFGRVLAGPYATMLLADLGADVVKIERPGTGDDTRSWGPPWVAGESTYFLGLNRNKRSATLDLGTREGLDAARKLAGRADVVVENFRPGTMDRLGLGYQQLKVHNPGLVYCSITGFGPREGASLPGYDLLVQAVGGLMSITGPDSSQPTKVGVALVDVITGLHAAVGILAALRHRDRTGHGQQVEVNLLSSLLSAMTNQAAAYLAAGTVPAALGNRHPSIAPYEVFPTADRPLVIAVGNDRQFQALVGVLGLPGLADDPRFATNPSRVAHRDDLFATLRTALLTRSADDWFAELLSVGVPVGPINDIRQAFDLASRLGLRSVVEIDDPARGGACRQVANPISLSATPATYRQPPPRLGADDAGGHGPGLGSPGVRPD
ncbi:CaiB/BaiF CoA transferase family protein [Micromonospora sp. SL1-18]|uniref:CaiB/BaiF CoA transferase family protein n=1 Tax=Micromonospora sp. SL1-18 TaxID=3399128 RepID=UPI003A4DE95F